MKLFYSPNSPYARKVRIMAHEKGVFERFTLIKAAPTDNPPELHAANPLGKIPAIVTDSGENIFDSPVICEYLDHIGQGPSLIPARFEDRLQARKLEALADGIMDALVSRFLEKMRPENEQSPRWIGRWESAIARALNVLEQEYLPRLGPDLTIGHVALSAALGYLDLRYPEFDWKPGHPQATAWLTEFSKRDSMVKTAPEV